jgi:prevent-host-death family protein
MISEATAVSFRQNLGDMLNQVQYRHDSIVIKRDGKPVAALVDARLFERICRLQARFDGLCERIESGYAEVPEAEPLAEIDAAVVASRAGRFGALAALRLGLAQTLVTGDKALLTLRDRYPIRTPADFWAVHGGL